MTSSAKHVAGEQFQVKDRKARFVELNDLVTRGGGWLTSVPGAPEVSLEVLPSSTLPSELTTLGYELEAEPDGQRLLPAAITEAVLMQGSTVPLMVTHAGIVRVERYSFPLH
jgi:hypothetical protein